MPNKIKIKQIEGLREELDDLGKEIFLYTENVVWVSKSGNDGTGTVGRFDLPFLTVNAAEDAATEEGVTVSGAGSTSANLTYDYHGSFTNGKRSYTNGSFTVEWNDSLARWEIKSGSSTLYISTSDTTYPWEATGWSANDGDSPAPTVSQRRGSTIIVLEGDYSGESSLAGKDGLTYQGLDGAVLPAFDVAGDITIKGSGLCQSITCTTSSGAVVDMPDMDTIDLINCSRGTVIAGNSGNYIECEVNGTMTVKNAENYILCDGDNATITAGNAGRDYYCERGNMTIRNANQSHDGSGFGAAIYILESGNLTIENSFHESTEEDGIVVKIDNNWSGSLKIFNSRLKATNAGTNGETIGIRYGTDVTGTVQLDGVIIETAQDGTGTAKSIDSSSEQTVKIVGSLSATHDVDENIILSGGDFIINEDIKA